MKNQVKLALSAEQLQKLSALPASESLPQDENPRRRPDFQRDEYGLPPKDLAPSEPK